MQISQVMMSTTQPSFITSSSKQHIKSKTEYGLKQTNSNAVQKLQQIIVRLQKI